MTSSSRQLRPSPHSHPPRCEMCGIHVTQHRSRDSAVLSQSLGCIYHSFMTLMSLQGGVVVQRFRVLGIMVMRSDEIPPKQNPPTSPATVTKRTVERQPWGDREQLQWALCPRLSHPFSRYRDPIQCNVCGQAGTEKAKPVPAASCIGKTPARKSGFLYVDQNDLFLRREMWCRR